MAEMKAQSVSEHVMHSEKGVDDPIAWSNKILLEKHDPFEPGALK